MSTTALDGIIIACGLYLLVSALMMNARKELPKMLISSNLDISKLKKKDNYIKTMFPTTVIMSIVIIAGGLADIYFAESEYARIIQMITFVSMGIAIIVYGIISVKAQRKLVEENQ